MACRKKVTQWIGTVMVKDVAHAKEAPLTAREVAKLITSGDRQAGVTVKVKDLRVSMTPERYAELHNTMLRRGRSH